VSLRPPAPVLCRSAKLPTGRGWSYEPKIDGFRLRADTGKGFHAVSRRGHDFAERLPELRVLPPGLQLDGEIYAPGADGSPDFHRLGARLLRGERGIAVVYAVFDLLAVDDIPTLDMPYRDRHALLGELELPTICTVVESFDDPDALWQAVLELRLEGVVAKRESDRYRPGEKLWIRRKSRRWLRHEEERELAMRRRRRIVPNEPAIRRA